MLLSIGSGTVRACATVVRANVAPINATITRSPSLRRLPTSIRDPSLGVIVRCAMRHAGVLLDTNGRNPTRMGGYVKVFSVDDCGQFSLYGKSLLTRGTSIRRISFAEVLAMQDERRREPHDRLRRVPALNLP